MHTMQRHCKICGQPFTTWSSLQTKCYTCTPKIKQVGKQGMKYNTWRDTVARPYVIKRDGRYCYDCMKRGKIKPPLGHDLHHMNGRGENKYSLDDLRYLCRKCHQARHNIYW